MAANTAFSATFNGLPTAAIALRAQFGLDAVQLGWLLGAMGLGIAVSELPWGALTDRWGDRPVLITGLGGTALMLGVLAWASAAVPGGSGARVALGAGLFVLGVFGGSVNGASGRAILQNFPPHERGMAMSVRQTAIPLGGALGALLLPVLCNRYGMAAGFTMLAALTAGSLAAVVIWLKEAAPVSGSSPADERHRVGRKTLLASADGPRAALRDREIWRLALGTGLLCAPQFAVLAFGVLFLHDHAGLSAAHAALVIVALQVASMVARILCGRRSDRRGDRRAFLRRACLLNAAVFAVLGLSAFDPVARVMHGVPGGGAAFCVLMLFLSGVCISAWHGVAYAEVGGVAGVNRAGTALGITNTAVFLANFAAPVACAQFLTHLGWPAVWLAAAVCALSVRPLFGGREQHERLAQGGDR
ncbi:MFS transporter [Chitinasiproducens palmae]|uniref:MFS transporter n=1 Tax=Chitinasiproducens palmae TaxID=1770053 RepID=UPI001F2F9BA0|nr:MFS transporter [Chitinasiproducens palmae]